jgi:hypothetical protein
VSRTPLLASGSSAGKRSFESAPTEITSEYGTEWLEGQMETVNKLAEVCDLDYIVWRT